MPRPPALGIRSRGELHGRIFELRPGSQSIGREPDCELRIDDASVSRRHALVVRDGDAVSIEDSGSTNGTSVNGEPLSEGRRRLHSGDLVRIGGIDLVHLAGSEPAARRVALLQPPEDATSVRIRPLPAGDETPALQAGPSAPPPGPQPKPESSPLTPAQLGLSGAAASVTALLLSGLHVNRLGATFAAGVTAIITTFLQTRGRKQWLRVGGGAGLALILAVTGISVPELALGHALTDPDRSATFLPSELTSAATPTTNRTGTRGTTRPAPGPGISISPTPDDCGQVQVGQSFGCPTLMVHSTGSSPLRVTSIDPPSGPGASDFEVPVDDCVGRELSPGERCTIEVTFTPTQAQERSATIAVHQNLPRPDTGTIVRLMGVGVGTSPGTAPTTSQP